MSPSKYFSQSLVNRHGGYIQFFLTIINNTAMKNFRKEMQIKPEGKFLEDLQDVYILNFDVLLHSKDAVLTFTISA